MAKDDGGQTGSRAEYVEPVIPQDAPGEGRVILRDGQTALIQSVDQRDEGLQAFVRRETGDVRLYRVFGIEKGAGGADQRTILGVYQGEKDERGLIAAGGWLQTDLSKPVAEVGFLVRADKRGLGLGTILLEQLALVGLRRGIDFFTAEVAPDNREMLRVFQDSGFEIRTVGENAPLALSFAIRPNRRSVEQAERRERIATVASLRPFFQPKSVAVIGASRNPDAIGRRIFEYLLMNHFEGPVYPVNPSAKVVGSVPAYPSVSVLPERVDLAVIAVPRDAVIPTVEQCGRAGVRAVVVITAGFAETGSEGRALQARLVETAQSYGMRIVGPNCLGLLNADPGVRLNASFSPIFPPYGPVSMSSQSGALGIAILQYATEMGLGMANFISVGNKADVSGNDLLEYWEDDPKTGLILLYLESFGNPRRFSRIARRVGRKKPVLVVKSGRTDVGHRAAGSHTAALAANETMVDALFEQAGVIRADTLEEMFDVAALLAYQPVPAGKRIAVVTNAGGPGILAADVLAGMGLSLPETSPELQQTLGKVLPSTASRKNPVDMIASATADQYRRVLEEILSSPEYDAAIVIFLPVGLTPTEQVAQGIMDALKTLRAREISKPVATVLMGQGVPAALRVGDTLVPNYRFPEGAARALARAYRYGVWRDTPEGIIPDFDDLDVDRARALIQEQLDAGASWLDPGATADLFACFGLPWAGGRVAATPEEAEALAREVGFPAVVKMVSRTQLHKSEWGGVVLGLTDGGAVREACRGIRERLAQAGKEKELDGFLVQPMIQGGVELMVGVTTDPQFGPLIAFGLGGIYVEVLRDVVFRVTPLTDRGAREMVRGIRGHRLLQGYRGHAAADVQAVEDLLLRLSRMVEELPEVAELDLNPVMALEPGRGCRIVDARVRVARAGR